MAAPNIFLPIEILDPEEAPRSESLRRVPQLGRSRSEAQLPAYPSDPLEVVEGFLSAHRKVSSAQQARILLNQFRLKAGSGDMQNSNSDSPSFQELESDLPAYLTKIESAFEVDSQQEDPDLATKFVFFPFLQSIEMFDSLSQEFRRVLQLNQKEDSKVKEMAQSRSLFARWISDTFRNQSRKELSNSLRSSLKSKANEKLKQLNQKKLSAVKSIFKNYAVLQKCNDIRNKMLISQKCKLCAQEIEVDELADHSFKCFESKILREEMDKINKMVIKLRSTCANTKNKLCKKR